MLHAAIVLTSLFQVAGPPQAPDQQRALPGAKPGTERWIVTFNKRNFDLTEFRKANYGDATADDVARIVRGLEQKVQADQAAFVEFVESLGGMVVEQYWLINGCAIEIAPKQLARIKAHANVNRLDADQMCYPILRDATNSKNHNSDSTVARGFTGLGVSSAIMDTGLDSNMAGTGRPHRTFYIDGDIKNTKGGGMKGSRMLDNVKMGLVGPDDVHNHGTGVASIVMGGKWGSGNADFGHAPKAQVVGYCIADNSGGGAQYTTITRAWQRIAADAKKFNIVSANNSYTGSPDPKHASQQALDACALNANVLPVCAAGNSSSSTGRSQSVANGLAVGATNHTVKTMASFSSRGPMFGDTKRFYPDLCGNGVNVHMALRDRESGDYRASGTSFGSPQVCGAATVFRAFRKTANALQTKAAILATTEDISKKNTRPPYNTRNAYGLGYLRIDRLMSLATGGLITRGQLKDTTTPATFNMTVTKGKAYSIVTTWNRHTLASTNWSDLKMEVRQGAKVLATSDDPRNLYERCIFLATATGPVQIRVQAKTLEKNPLDIAVVGGEIPPPFIEGKALSYGVGCKGTGSQIGVQTVLPTDHASKMGTQYSELGLGYDNHRYMQVFNSTAVPGSFQARQIAFRMEDLSWPGAIRGYWIDLQIQMGYSKNDPSKVDGTFANNVTGTPTTVLNRKRINLPDWTALNKSPTNFAVKIALDRAFVHQTTSGKFLFVDMRKFNSSKGNTAVNYFTDAFLDSQKMYSSRIWGKTPTATSGAVYHGFGIVMGFNPVLSGAVPQMNNSGEPEIGGSYQMNVVQGAPNAAALAFMGFSDKNWGAIPLPLKLDGLGGTGCSLLTGITISQGIKLTTSGTGSATWSIPNSKALIQANLYHQMLIIDPKANKLGLVFTNGIIGIVGGQP